MMMRRFFRPAATLAEHFLAPNDLKREGPFRDPDDIPTLLALIAPRVLKIKLDAKGPSVTIVLTRSFSEISRPCGVAPFFVK